SRAFGAWRKRLSWEQTRSLVAALVHHLRLFSFQITVLASCPHEDSFLIICSVEPAARSNRSIPQDGTTQILTLSLKQRFGPPVSQRSRFRPDSPLGILLHVKRLRRKSESDPFRVKAFLHRDRKS